MAFASLCSLVSLRTGVVNLDNDWHSTLYTSDLQDLLPQSYFMPLSVFVLTLFFHQECPHLFPKCYLSHWVSPNPYNQILTFLLFGFFVVVNFYSSFNLCNTESNTSAFLWSKEGVFVLRGWHVLIVVWFLIPKSKDKSTWRASKRAATCF